VEEELMAEEEELLEGGEGVEGEEGELSSSAVARKVENSLTCPHQFRTRRLIWNRLLRGKMSISNV
jgi:hypothetical protein